LSNKIAKIGYRASFVPNFRRSGRFMRPKTQAIVHTTSDTGNANNGEDNENLIPPLGQLTTVGGGDDDGYSSSSSSDSSSSR